MLDLKELNYVDSAYSAGTSLAILVNRDLTEEEFDEVYDLLYDEGIDTTSQILIEQKSIVKSKVNLNDTLKFIVSEGTQVYKLA